MKSWKIVLFGLLTIVLGFPLILVITNITSFNSGNAPVTAAIYNGGISAVIASILVLCAVVVSCTLFIIRAINRQK